MYKIPNIKYYIACTLIMEEYPADSCDDWREYLLHYLPVDKEDPPADNLCMDSPVDQCDPLRVKAVLDVRDRIFRPPVAERKLNQLKKPVAIWFTESVAQEEVHASGRADNTCSISVEFWYPNVQGYHEKADNAIPRFLKILNDAGKLIDFSVGSDNFQEDGVTTRAGGTQTAIIRQVSVDLVAR